jgi:hypothetical protein
MNANSDKEYIDNKASDLRAVMTAGFAQSRAEFDAEIAKAVSHLVKWVVGLFFATVAINVALASMVMHLVINVSASPVAPLAAPSQTIATPAVIIQLTPQGATILPAAPAAAKP